MSRGVPSIAEDRAAKGRGHGREEIDRAGAGERDAGRAAADPGRPAHPGGRGPGRELLRLGRGHLRTLGHPALEQAHAAGLPPGRDGLRPLPRPPLARGIDPALHGLGRGRPRVPRSDARRVQGPQDHQPPDRVACRSFYKYLQGVASEFRLPITVPNPAHAQFIPRGSSDPRDETKALSATRARQLMGLPSGDTVFDYRDRAIIKFFLYSGARIGTACRLRVKDFHQDGEEATVTLHEKGDKHRRIGLHFAAAEAIAAYIAKAELTKGPLFRARLNSRSQKLGRSPIGAVTMYNLVQGYLARLPASLREEEVTDEDGTVTKVKRCIYTPHSLRATTATLLLDAGVDIIKVKELLGHRHVTTTQIYDKRRRSLKEGASHDVPI